MMRVRVSEIGVLQVRKGGEQGEVSLKGMGNGDAV